MNITTYPDDKKDTTSLIKQRRLTYMDSVLDNLSRLELSMIKITANFPRRERQFIVKYIRDEITDLYKCVIKAGKSDKPKSSLYESLTLITLITIQIRRSMELKYISYNQYNVNVVITVNIKKLIGSWIDMER